MEQERATPTTTDIAATIRDTAENPAPADDGTANLLSMLEQSRIGADEEIEPEEFLFSWYAVAFMPRRNIVSLKAPAKSGKTFALTAFALAFLNGDYFGLKSQAQADEVLLFIDTEQSRNDTRKVLKRITSQATSAEPRIEVLNVKNTPAKERLPLIDLQVKTQRPALIIVDGIADLIPGMDYNDQGAADKVITTLSRIAEDNNAVVICAIHTNNKDDFATGWLGRLLRQKCAMELSLKRNGKNSTRTLEASAVRHREIEPLTIDIEDTEDGLGRARIVNPADAERTAKEEKRHNQRQRLIELGIDPPLTIARVDLLAMLKTKDNSKGEKYTKQAATKLINSCIEAGALRVDGERLLFDA